MDNSVYFFSAKQKQSFQCKEETVYFSIKNYPLEEYKCLIKEYSSDKISEIKTQFDNILNISNPNLAYETFLDILKTNLLVKNVKTASSLEASASLNPWITTGIKKSILVRNKLFRKRKNQVLAKYYKSKIKHYINILRTNYYRKELLKIEKNRFKFKGKNLDSKVQESLELKSRKEFLTEKSKRQWDIINKYLKREKNCNFTGNINEMNKFFVNIGPNLASKIPHCKPEQLYSNERNSIYFSKICTKEISDRILDLSI